MKASADRIASLLDRRAAREGRVWAAEVRAAVLGQRRAAAGGWPGTLSEARARLAAMVLPRLALPASTTLMSSARESAARILYDSARRVWLAQREREESP